MKKQIFAALLLFFVSVSIRLPGIKASMGVDEPDWLVNGLNFYYALGQREFDKTVYEYHPSVTTMWYVAAATHFYFPAARGLGRGYFNPDKQDFDPFLLAHGKSPLQLLYLSRVIQVFAISLALLAAYFFLSRFIGAGAAFWTILFAGSAPFFLGHSRTLSHEGQVAAFALASLLGLYAYLRGSRRPLALMLSALFAALAQLTKSSALAILPAVGVMFAVAVFTEKSQRGFLPAFWRYFKIFLLWLLALMAAYFILWPGMWVAPGRMLHEVYGNAFSYAFEGARLSVTESAQAVTADAAPWTRQFSAFAFSLVMRATPPAWIGFALALIFLFLPGDSFTVHLRWLSLYLILNALSFVLLFSVSQGRNSAHYILAAALSLDVVAALGWAALARRARLPLWARMSSAAALLLWLALQVQPFYPYYYNYANAWLGRSYQSDYGEGFERAAAYLSQKPGAENLTAFSYRGRGAFSYFFSGKTLFVNPLFFDEPGMASVVERISQSDYLVLNEAFFRRSPRAELFGQILSQFVQPEQTLQTPNAFPIYVYYVKDLPPAFYEALANTP